MIEWASATSSSISSCLGLKVGKEVEASASAWVDVV